MLPVSCQSHVCNIRRETRSTLNPASPSKYLKLNRLNKGQIAPSRESELRSHSMSQLFAKEATTGCSTTMFQSTTHKPETMTVRTLPIMPAMLKSDGPTCLPLIERRSATSGMLPRIWKLIALAAGAAPRRLLLYGAKDAAVKSRLL